LVPHLRATFGSLFYYSVINSKAARQQGSKAARRQDGKTVNSKQ